MGNQHVTPAKEGDRQSSENSVSQRSQDLLGNQVGSDRFQSDPQPYQQAKGRDASNPRQTRPLFRGLSHELQADAASSGMVVQAKMTVRPAGDRYEQEADRVAAQVVQQMHAASPSSVNQPDATQSAVQAQASQLEAIQPKSIQSGVSAEGGMAVTPELEASIGRARSGGQPLPDTVREPMEQAMGADFRGVRVHTDGRSDQLNRSIQARAFTTGYDIFLRQGKYSPYSQQGQLLIAHELTHVMQQMADVPLKSTLQGSEQNSIKRTAINQHSQEDGKPKLTGKPIVIQRNWEELEAALRGERALTAFELVKDAQDENLNKKDSDGNNPLHLVVKLLTDSSLSNARNFVDVALYLVQKKRTLLAEQNKDGKTPLEILLDKPKIDTALLELLYYLENDYKYTFNEKQHSKGKDDLKKQKDWEKNRAKTWQKIINEKSVAQPSTTQLWEQHIVDWEENSTRVKKIVNKIQKIYQTSEMMRPIIELASWAMLGKHDRSYTNESENDLKIIITASDKDEEAMEDSRYRPGGSLKAATGANRIFIRIPKNASDDQIAESVGVILHELTHYVADEVYKDAANPYGSTQQGAEYRKKVVEATQNIAETWKESKAITPEGIVADAYFGQYGAIDREREVIVRVSEIIGMKGAEAGEKWLQDNTPGLLKYFKENFNPAIIKHLENRNYGKFDWTEISDESTIADRDASSNRDTKSRYSSARTATSSRLERSKVSSHDQNISRNRSTKLRDPSAKTATSSRLERIRGSKLPIETGARQSQSIEESGEEQTTTVEHSKRIGDTVKPIFSRYWEVHAPNAELETEFNNCINVLGQDNDLRGGTDAAIRIKARAWLREKFSQ